MFTNLQKTLLASLSITLLIIAVVIYSFDTGLRIAERYSPLVDASMEIKLEATTAHLWFEELISGDRHIEIEEVWAHLDASEWYARAMLEGGENKEGTFLALNDPRLRSQIEETITGIINFRAIAMKRWEAQSSSGIGSDIDQEFDKAFADFNLSADSVETALQEIILERIDSFKTLRTLLIFLVVTLSIIATLSLLIYSARLNRHISALALSEREVSRSQKQLHHVITGASLGYWDWNYQTGGHYVNDEWLSMLGLSRNSIANNVSDWEDLIHPEDKEPTQKIVNAHIKSGETYVSEFRMRHADGSWVWIQGSGAVVEYDNNQPLRLCGTHQNITERKKAEEQLKENQAELKRLSYHDYLTNLPNRALLSDRLSQSMLQCHRHKKSLAVTFVDLDGFKIVNDDHGHDVGDELLILLSVRLKEALREGDTLARIGGDEFIVVLEDIENVADCEPILERLLLAASKPFIINSLSLNVSASIGVTLYPQDSSTPETLIKHADQAMYMAKKSGKNKYHFFNPDLDAAVESV